MLILSAVNSCLLMLTALWNSTIEIRQFSNTLGVIASPVYCCSTRSQSVLMYAVKIFTGFSDKTQSQ